MKRTVLTFGVISGVVMAILMWSMMLAMRAGAITLDSGEIWGYTTMIVALSMVFFGIRSYRDNNGGSISFFKGLLIGLLISLIASVFYSLSWELYYRTLGGNFMAEYIALTMDKMQAAGKPAAEIEEMRSQMDAMTKYYNIFVFRFGMTLMEILPVGIIVSLVSAALLRKKSVAQPAAV